MTKQTGAGREAKDHLFLPRSYRLGTLRNLITEVIDKTLKSCYVAPLASGFSASAQLQNSWQRLF